MGSTVNKCLFPKPNPPTYSESNPYIKWIESKNETVDVPVYFLANDQPADKVIFFFHGNAEDLGSSESFLLPMMREWEAHAVAMEDPTYGVYKKGELNEKRIQEDSLAVYDEVKKQLGLNDDQIIIVGRSIGSGPATYLASQRNCGCFVLISPFKSVEDVAGDMCCLLKCLCLCRCICSCMPCYYFQNKRHIKSIRAPTYLVHGESDEVIHVSNGKELIELSSAATKGQNFPPNMTHNHFDLKNDIIDKVTEFLRKIELLGEEKKESLKKVDFRKFKSSK